MDLDFEEKDYLEFLVTETDDDGIETTWSWDGERWTRVSSRRVPAYGSGNR